MAENKIEIEIDKPYIPDEDVQVFESEIEYYLNEYISTQGIEDMKAESQSQWNAALLYIYKYVFKNDRKKLKAKPYKTDNNLKYNNVSNYNAYNLDLINDISDIYINLCYMYDKEISISGFCKLTGIDYNTVNEWKKETRNRSSTSISSCDIYKKLHREQEESLSSMLVTGKKNPMGILAKLNTFYDWRTTKTETIKTEKQALSLEDRQRELAGLIDSQPQNIVVDIQTEDVKN